MSGGTLGPLIIAGIWGTYLVCLIVGTIRRNRKAKRDKLNQLREKPVAPKVFVPLPVHLCRLPEKGVKYTVAECPCGKTWWMSGTSVLKNDWKRLRFWHRRVRTLNPHWAKG